MAKLHFKYGAMNSGKSDTLIKTAYNYVERGLNVLVIKPSVDTKGDNFVVSRGGHKRKVDIFATDDKNLESAILNKQDKTHCVLVDEAQFLNNHHVSSLFHIAKKHDISVIAFGLKTDFQTNLFPGSRRLLELADNIEKLPTMCRCGQQAEYNARKIDGNFVFDGGQIAIDDSPSVKYDSLCGSCYASEGGTI